MTTGKMRQVVTLIGAGILMWACSGQKASQDSASFLDSEAAYLKQKPPELTPKVFAPGVISTEDSLEFAVTFSPDGTELYFTSRAPGAYNRILFCRYEPEGWTAPAPASFALPQGEFEPGITPDGLRLFYASIRPLPGTTDLNMDPGIWFVERKGREWGEPQYFGDNMFHLSFSQSNTLYCSARSSDGKPGYICRVASVDGTYAQRENLGEKNAFFHAAHQPCVALDESYVVFTAREREGGMGGLDLYVSFQQPEGTWNEPINLGEKINTEAAESSPSLSPDGKYLFYTSGEPDKGDIMWVSTEILEGLRPPH